MNDRTSQRDRLLALLKARANQWVSVRDVADVAGLQYNARIFELRALGHPIQNYQEGARSWFRLVVKAATPVPAANPPRDPELLFPPDGCHRDLG
jgi:hypothetical protein